MQRILPLCFWLACSPATTMPQVADGGGSAVAMVVPGTIPKTTQRPGDPARGYLALINNGYIGCGVPYSLYAAYAKLFPTSESDKLAGRTGLNLSLPYYLTAFRTRRGVDAVAPNCLTCHATYHNGKVVIGLGEINRDYTQATSYLGGGLESALSLIGIVGLSVDEQKEIAFFRQHFDALLPYIVTQVRGVNPADSVAGVLAAHRDADTLAWFDTPQFDLPPKIALPIDVPPWWRMKKKQAMFYPGFGRGDHARIMMATSLVCSDTVEEANAIDAFFPDIRAYIASLEPPPPPFSVDQKLATTGRAVFETNCARCHGNGEKSSYPNLVVDIDEVGTDAIEVLGVEQTLQGKTFVDWFNRSWFGKVSHLESHHGYVAPPLDGISLTAPYLHNGSVPTLHALLDSSKRPTYFTRSFKSDDFDSVEVGLKYTQLDHGQAGSLVPPPSEIYDTTMIGYSNRGHTFGDALSEPDRHALLEYLKTL